MLLATIQENLLKSLEISGKALLALFFAMFLLYLSIVILSKIKFKK